MPSLLRLGGYLVPVPSAVPPQPCRKAALKKKLLLFFQGMEGSAALRLFGQRGRDFSAAGDSPPLPRTKHRPGGDAKGESLPCSGVLGYPRQAELCA